MILPIPLNVRRVPAFILYSGRPDGRLILPYGP
jgi:hypothetical protein